MNPLERLEFGRDKFQMLNWFEDGLGFLLKLQSVNA